MTTLETTQLFTSVYSENLGGADDETVITVTAPVDAAVTATRPRGLAPGQTYSVPFVVSRARFRSNGPGGSDHA